MLNYNLVMLIVSPTL